MKKIIPTLILSILFSSLYAQNNVYNTRNAILQVNGEYEGELMQGQTKALHISLDYETTAIVIRIQPNLLVFNIDSLNDILANDNQTIIFKGDLSLDHISTKSHPPLDFTVDGYLELGRDKVKLNGKGELHHLNDSGEYVGMLGLTLLLNLNELGVNIPIGLHEEVEVVITQAILKVDKN